MKKSNTGLVNCIPVIVDESFRFNDPEFPKNIASVRCMVYQDKPTFWEETAKAITGKAKFGSI